MSFGTLFCAGSTPACGYACKILSDSGISVTNIPDWNTKHLLLDVPSFSPGLWSEEKLDTLLTSLPKSITIWGGNLNHPLLESYNKCDLLKDEIYLQENADITADCTIPIAESLLKQSWLHTDALIIGWGRIGKALCHKLKKLGCHVSIYSRKPTHRTEASAYGYHITECLNNPQSFHLIVNTAPAHVLSITEDTSTVFIDLASIKGITGSNVTWARGLPGRYAPERSGKLIADSILRLSKEVF